MLDNSKVLENCWNDEYTFARVLKSGKREIHFNLLSALDKDLETLKENQEEINQLSYSHIQNILTKVA